MTVELNRVHLQRLRGAIEAARLGRRVSFRIHEGEPATIVWYEAAIPRVPHVIANLYGQRQEWMAAVLAAFYAETEGTLQNFKGLAPQDDRSERKQTGQDRE